MKKYCPICVVVLAFSLLISLIGAQENDFPVLKGPYLGQAPPVDKPLSFAPGIVSTDAGNHSSPAFTPDGNEIYWSMRGKIWVTRLASHGWSQPEMLSICKDDTDMYDNPFISTDGDKLFFTSSRPLNDRHEKYQEYIWCVERSMPGWTEPKSVGPKVNSVRLHWSFSVSDSGTLYCSIGNDICYAELIDGEYTKPVNIGPIINTPAVESCPYVAPDESYIVFTRFDETNFKNTGIFISFRDKAGNWLPPALVAGGDKKSGGFSPRISPDGKYLFYINGDAGTFWMPATFIEELRPK